MAGFRYPEAMASKKPVAVDGPQEHRLPLRVVVVDPPPDVIFSLQRGSSEVVAATRSSGASLAFDFDVRARPEADGSLRLLGPFTQGPPSARFVYVNSGTYAGAAGSGWGRRAKVPLSGITSELLERALATPNSLLEARIPGRSRDGGPVCASVRLLDPGWSVVSG